MAIFISKAKGLLPVFALGVAALPASGETFVWASANDGYFDEKTNWLVSDAAASRAPGEGDAVLFTNGAYTVTLRGDTSLDSIDLTCGSTANITGQTDTDVTMELGGNTLAAATRINASICTWDYAVKARLTLRNGKVRCDQALTSSGQGLGLTVNGNFGSTYTLRLGGRLSLENVEVLSDKASLFNSYRDGGVRLSLGTTWSIDGPLQLMGNPHPLALSGNGTVLDASEIWNERTQDLTSCYEENRGIEVSDGAVLNTRFLYVTTNDGSHDGRLAAVSGGKINLSIADTANDYKSGVVQNAVNMRNLNVERFLFLVSGKGSEINLTGEATTVGRPCFPVGNKSGCRNNSLQVLDGGRLQGPSTSMVSLGAGESTNNCIVVSNGTLDVGVIWTGSAVRYVSPDGTQYFGSVSNNVLHVAGTNPLVRVTSSAGYNATYCKGALTLVYDTILRYDVPETGYVSTPIQVVNHKCELHRTTIPGFEDQPACRLVLNARAWARKHPKGRLVLMETAQSSTSAMTELVNHASFPDLEGWDDEQPGELTIEDGGTKLVYTAPARSGFCLMLR